MAISDLATATATEVARAVAARELSAVEAAAAAIARIEARDGPINAVVVRDFDRALEAARAADALIAAGERRPLLGVPMTVKESHNMAGLPTTWGLEGAKDFIASEDSVGVTRLKGAGAVILGKTNVPPSLGDWQATNPIYGRTSNPLDLTRSPGGSSGGGAAALASGMVHLEFGSDIGGSVRVPAALCGVYGHKPSYELIPTRGHAPPGVNGAPPPLAVVGPLARSMDDIALAMNVLAGPDDDLAVAYPLNLKPPRHLTLAGYRVLILDTHPTCATASEIRTALARIASGLQRAGATVARQSPLVPDLAAQQATYGYLLGAVTSRGARAGDNGGGGAAFTAHGWLDALDQQLAFRRQWAELFKSFDVVITPTFGTEAFPHQDAENWGERKLIIDGVPTPYGAQISWPGVATLPHLPATAVPIGVGAAGLPISAQVIGPFLEDRTCLAVAAMLAGL